MAGDLAQRSSSELARGELAALLRIHQVIGRQLEREPLFAAIAQAIQGFLPADRVIVLVPGVGPAEMSVYAVHGAAKLVEGERIPEGSAPEWVMRERQPLLVSRRDAVRERFPTTYAKLAQEGMESVAVLPLVAAERCLGALALMSRPTDAWADVPLRLLEEIATSVAVALDNCLAYEQKERMGRELRALLDVNAAVGRNLRRDDLFGAVAASLQHLLPIDRFGIELPIEDARLRGHLLTPRDGRVEPTQPHVLPAAGTACDWVIQHREWLVAARREELRERFPLTFEVMSREDVQSLCALPLLTGDRCRGVLFFMAAREGAYVDLQRGLLEQVAGAVAVALDNCLAHEEVESLRDRLAAENVYLQEEIRQDHNFGEVVGRSPALLRVLSQVEVAAPTNATVLILGETGTGKELIARAIHERSARRERPLVKVNCSAISAGLVESELFGHVKGAFTGAMASRVGRFELADGGTIFLDEIGELPLQTQVKLLRVLQEREFEPVGSSQTRRVDVRVIAATNRDLEKAIAEESFRSDLYFRLNVLPVTVPPLRERRDDVALLVHFFVDRYAREMGKRIQGVAKDTLERLVAYEWPGNVRELQNLIERAVVLARGPILELPADLLRSAPRTLRVDGAPGEREPVARVSAPGAAPPTLEEVEKHHVLAVLARVGWVIEGPRGAAVVLGLHPNTLRSRLKKLGLRRPGHPSATA